MGWGGVDENEPGEKSRFLEMGGVAFRSFSYNNLINLRAFFLKICTPPSPHRSTITHKRVWYFKRKSLQSASFRVMHIFVQLNHLFKHYWLKNFWGGLILEIYGQFILNIRNHFDSTRLLSRNLSEIIFCRGLLQVNEIRNQYRTWIFRESCFIWWYG